MRIRHVVVGLALALVCVLPAASEDTDERTPVEPAHPTHKTPVDIAEKATDPSAILAQLGFYYWGGVDEDRESDSQTYLFQPVLPLSKTNVLRPALPFLSTPSPGREGGMGDLFLLDAFFFQIPNATVGVGPVASLPTATDDKLGTGKFSLGFDFVFIYKGIKKNILGFILYPQFSVSGDDARDDVRNLSYQIAWVKHFKWGYMGWTDQLGVVDFEHDNRYTFPMGIRIGKVFGAKSGKTLLNLAVQPYYTYQDDRDNVYGLKIMATFIKPKWMSH